VPAVWSILDDEAEKLFGARKTSERTDAHLIRLVAVRRWLTDRTGGDLNVLILKRLRNIGCREAVIGEFARIEPESHRIFAFAEDDDVADALDTLDLVLEIEIGVIRKKDR